MFDRPFISWLKRNLGGSIPGWCRVAAFLVSVVAVGWTCIEVLPDWRNPHRGHEAYRIAKALAAGKGYSFASESRWLFDRFQDGLYHPTAWADPFYTFCLAGFIRLFGDYHALAALTFNLVLLLAVFGLTYRLGERLITPPAGLMAVAALALIRDFSRTAGVMNNTVLACAMVLLSALMLVKFLEGPSQLRAGALGLVLGLTTLACPGAQLFTPVTAAVIGVSGWRKLGPTVGQAVLVVAMAVLTVLPWTVRNYMVFGEFVPVRNGIGQLASASLIATAGTVAPERLRSNTKPSWSAVSPRAAVVQSIGSSGTNLDRQRALASFMMEYAKEVLPSEFAAMNESQRDAWFLKESKSFLLANPVLSAKLAIAKIEAFMRTPRVFYSIEAFLTVGVCLLAALGGVIAIRIRTPAVITLALWIGSYIVPFLLFTPLYYRYRAPIEPLLVVLAAFAVSRVLDMGFRGKSIV